MTKALIGAIKRKNLKDVVAEILLMEGKTEEAKEVQDAGRLTLALIDRTCVPVNGGAEEEADDTEEEESTDTPEVPETEEEAEEEAEDEARLTVGDIKDLVATGKKKKIKQAKEAFKAQFAKDHPNYKELKKLFKKAE